MTRIGALVMWCVACGASAPPTRQVTPSPALPAEEPIARSCGARVRGGIAARERGAIEEAVALLHQARALPGCPLAALNLSIVLRDAGRFEDAAEAARQALRQLEGEDRALAFEALALAWWSAGEPNDLERASLVGRQAIVSAPLRAASYNTLGVIELARGHVTEAVQLFERAHRLDPAFVPALANHARIALEHRDFGLAAELYARALTLIPDDPEFLAGLGHAQVGLGDASPSTNARLE